MAMLLFLVVSSSCQSLSVKGVGGLGFIILGILGGFGWSCSLSIAFFGFPHNSINT